MGQKQRNKGNRKGRSQFRSRRHYVNIKMGSASAKRSGIFIHPLLSGVDGNELFKKEKAENDKKEIA